VRFPDARVLVFAKAALPGQVKTRLIPHLTAVGAARLHHRLVSDTLERLTRAGVAPIELWCAPHPGLPFFDDLRRRFGAGLRAQSGGDLGERMLRAARDALCRCRRLVLLGTDCPELDGDYVAQALAALEERPAVLGPAQDGGYVLLGLKEAHRALFADVPWGSGEVARITRERMAALGWAWTELPTLWDLDRPADLDRFQAYCR
jgi:rSAM/selenodomain-associated transferase 1